MSGNAASADTESRATGAAPVWLVAQREIKAKAGSKAFLLSTAGLIVAMLLGGLLLKIAVDDDPPVVGFVPSTQSLADPVKQLSGEDAVRTKRIATRSAGDRSVRDGDLDALVTGSPERIVVVVKDQLDAGLRSTLTAVAQQETLSGQIRALGGDPASVAGAVADAAPEVKALEPNQVSGEQVLAGYLVGILIFLGLMTTGQMVAQGVVEEKSSRVVELLLAALRPWQLMAGKVTGIGLVGLVQVGAILLAAVGSAKAFDLVDTGSLNLASAALGAVGWFVIGYLTYALVMAGLASLVSRQEDVGSVLAPVMTLMIVPYVIAVSIGTWDPDNPLVATLSLIPFTAPLVMPVRIAAGEVPGWEIALSVGLSVALVPLLVWVAGRMYANSVLRTGARVSLRQALTSRG